MQNFDKDVVMDLLKDMKCFSTQCHMGALEASSEQLRNQCLQMMNDHLDQQWSMYIMSEQKGWYQILKPM